MSDSKDPLEQANEIVNKAFIELSDYEKLYECAERSLALLIVLDKRMGSLKRLIGVNCDDHMEYISSLLGQVESPYPDLDDTAFPEDDL